MKINNIFDTNLKNGTLIKTSRQMYYNIMVDIKGKTKKIGGANAIKHINKLISNNLTKDEIQLLKEYYIIDNNYMIIVNLICF